MEDLCVVYVCWDEVVIRKLYKVLGGVVFLESLLFEVVEKGIDLYYWVEVICKGREVDLLEGYSFYDKDGYEWCEICIKWW